MSEWKGLPGETPIDISTKIAGDLDSVLLDEAEALNVRKVVLKYFGRPRPTRRMAPFTLKWLKRLHQEMFGDVWEWAGCNRRAELNIGVKWHLIDEKLQQLLDDRACWEEN